MTLPGNQRWRNGRDSYRVPDEVINTREYDVALMAGDAEPRAFVTAHHYSGTYPAARIRVGLAHHGELVGVAVFSQPVRNEVLTNVFPSPVETLVELGRFILLDSVPGNGETWFLARAFELLRQHEIRGVVSFSDPMPRTREDGAIVFPGHLGTIYQAHNAAYLGRGTRRVLRLFPDGRVFSDRAASKIRKQERGWRYAAEQLQRYGAPAPGIDPRGWLKEWAPLVTRPLRHRGNHRYAWALDKKLRPALSDAGRYPKQKDVLNQ